MPYLITSYSETNYDNYVSVRSGGYQFYGQTFMNVSLNVLDSCTFYIRKLGSPTGSVYAYLYEHTGTFGTDGKPSGSAIAVSDALDISLLTTTFALKDLFFSGTNRVTLLANRPYCLAIGYSGGDASNLLRVGLDQSSPTASGNVLQYISSWGYNVSSDICFYVYGANPLGGTTNIKSINNLLYASISNKNGIAMASVKSINGLV